MPMENNDVPNASDSVILMARDVEKCVHRTIKRLEEWNCVSESFRTETTTSMKCLLKALTYHGDEKVVIALAGKFSSGKSSFINSLIGTEVAPVQAERTTRCKTVFTGNPQSGGKIKIVNGAGHACTLSQYRLCSSKASKKNSQYTVYIPNPDWQSFAIVDTPGFDPAETCDGAFSDDAISRLAVSESDVVFFIIEMNNGTIAKDSMDYLKEINKLGRQRIFIVINKADLKSPLARETIMASIAGECDRNNIRYDGILPYSSLLPTSSVILNKPESVRQNVLKAIDEMREKLFSVIETLSTQYQEILKKKRLASDRDAISKIDEIVQKIRKMALKAKKVVFADVPNDGCELRSIINEITDILTDQAVACTSDNASSMIKREELEGTGWIVEDWKVSLGATGNAYKISARDRASLKAAITSCLEPITWGDAKLATKCAGLLETVSRRVISSYRGTSDFEEQVGYEFECDEAEEAIVERLNEQFPDDFRKKCRDEIRHVLAVAKKESEELRLNDRNAQIQFLETSAAELNSFHSAVKKILQ